LKTDTKYVIDKHCHILRYYPLYDSAV